jgi:excisionase family DNA binding protein
MKPPVAIEAMLTPAEVARIYGVDPKTVTRWAKAGKLASVKTLGGHRRYVRSEVLALLAATEMRVLAEFRDDEEPS